MGVVHDPASYPPQALEALGSLFSECSARGIRVCHWKSNSHLTAALRGETDLDLLVHRDDRPAFLELLDERGVMMVRAAPGKDYPDVENHLGMDSPTGRLFHLHVHYALILGQQHVKDYVVPLEGRFLEWTRDVHGVPTPAAALELIVLRARALLKYRLRDGVKDMLKIRNPGVPRHIVEELTWLEASTTAEEMADARRLTRDVLPWVVLDQVQDASTERRGLRMLRLRGRLRACLRRYRRTNRSSATIRYAAALTRKRFGPRRRMTLQKEGRSIAVIGADGAGKSSLVKALDEWLGWRLTVRTYYMGTAEPSPRTAASKWVAKKSGAAARRLRHGRSGRPPGPVTFLAEGFAAARRLSEATDRLRRSNRAQRQRAAGAIVLFDRFPLPGVVIGDRTMDGPRIRTESMLPARLLEAMARREEVRLARVSLPDLVIAVNVDPAVSLERSPDHEPAAIAAKAAAVASMEEIGTEVVTVDGNRTFDEVLGDVRHIVWGHLCS
jgi:thymidylate kinase